MGTCNFTKVNARRYYVVDDRMYYNESEECWQDEPIEGAEVAFQDWDEIRDNLQWRATKRKEDGGRFTAVEEREHDWTRHRDAGTVILEYRGADVFLSPDCCVNLYGKIILRPGYYQAATLDWDLEAVGTGDHWYLNDYDSLEDLAEDIFQDWEYYEETWNAGLKVMQWDNIRKKITAALEALGQYLDDVCAYLCGEDNVYACTAVFSNGEAVYTKVNTPRGQILAAVANL